MEAEDLFQNSFIDDDGKEYRFISNDGHLNVIINGKPFFEFEQPYKLVSGIRHACDIYDCVQICNGKELKIYHSQKEDKWIAMVGVVNANLRVMD
ncbi:hypothetical protein [uncultured Draconibacterium sp.]|uniref:hypothetical protein n=1 Tax=uncultured Draconibacterium sp. TaxID=1573823 RepID=UPI0029C938B5|nr:hypothetical protein [uncultured Draconibacterium sp.]